MQSWASRANLGDVHMQENDAVDDAAKTIKEFFTRQEPVEEEDDIFCRFLATQLKKIPIDQRKDLRMQILLLVNKNL